MENIKLQCNLKDILKGKNISIKKLSEDINERRSTISDLANNKEMENRHIPATLLAKLRTYLNVPFDELFTVIEENKKES
ncbi:helix-turn-helix domain-containing protein [Priestia megaterium]|uniref:helix-turn-helix domain-containing protein n=1 Tax=Priestia megaterium TaxID=1404 RepID=UPI0039C39734